MNSMQSKLRNIMILIKRGNGKKDFFHHKIFRLPYCNKNAFTLVEVLITVGIIGVISSITLPTLLQNYQKQNTAEKLKKAYTNLANAVRQSEEENGNVEYWDWGNMEGLTTKESFDLYWRPYLKILKTCNTYGTCNYPSSNLWKNLSNSETAIQIVNTGIKTTVILADGTALSVYSTTGAGLPVRQVYIDINASKQPNAYGKDVFIFTLDKNNGFMPYGYKTIDSSNDCVKGSNGRICAAKIMHDGWKIKDDYPWN